MDRETLNTTMTLLAMRYTKVTPVPPPKKKKLIYFTVIVDGHVIRCSCSEKFYYDSLNMTNHATLTKEFFNAIDKGMAIYDTHKDAWLLDELLLMELFVKY